MESQMSRFPNRHRPFQSCQSRWSALTRRDPSAHSSFLYGVITTKIYCRPTCTARLARRANVVFFETEDQARRDGFRPCKRCQPDNASFVGGAEEVVSSVLGLLREKKDASIMKRGLKELADEVGVTTSYLCRVFKKKMGITVGAYMKEFEKEATPDETEDAVQILPQVVHCVVTDAETGLLTPSMPSWSSLDLLEGWEAWQAEGDVGVVQGAMNLDFDLDEWLWTQFISSESVEGTWDGIFAG